MKRTRKWTYVEQEARRLAGLRLSPREIAKQLGVNKSTVTRWMAAGKLGLKGSQGAKRSTKVKSLSKGGKTPAQWAAAVRKDYDLDATDEQLVTLAQDALGMSRDRKLAERVRLSAMDRFKAIVKQLALVTRGEEAPAKPESKPATPEMPAARPVPVQRLDPRRVLMAVK